MKIRVLVSYKESVLDPQGQTVRNSLLTLGYEFIRNLRQGKVFELDIDDLPREQVNRLIPEIAGKVLANPIIEQFEWEILDEKGETRP
ncbi:MAG: phosphoribosylformylglycinamidine synthase subunit PurS [Acidobacteria bacterium]|nr:phosphoribosylformylglycinamidine synthase subunit PurS [Acidobacteriota bacterium]MCG2815102.1 phosphoribosylformylglycinamidine synthase subunit PurS [Candidatus Aminicenantes bacterium]MBU1338856.1 phosphoribosylformylglycinamidine synthase subunit PurS [Acidobacteriota bacterium]MBU1473531.1 phosphoribosylformylglycinamidine synthase subunit PurS [Acidobacteriota bacterium]MBU2437602.1 phosphoribosylformylglycinamidine synthase subunit PurS [Acidobacteriota bacterium]